MLTILTNKKHQSLLSELKELEDNLSGIPEELNRAENRLLTAINTRVPQYDSMKETHRLLKRQNQLIKRQNYKLNVGITLLVITCIFVQVLIGLLIFKAITI